MTRKESPVDDEQRETGAMGDGSDAREVRRRVAVVAVGAVVTGATTAAVTDLLPLVASDAYALTKHGFSRLLGARSIGTMFGVLLLSALIKRIGLSPHWAATALMAAVAPLLMSVGSAPVAVFAVGLMLQSGCLSTCYVQLNALCQHAHPARQGAVNAMYRGLGQATAIVLPYLSTHVLVGESAAGGAGPILGFRAVGFGVLLVSIAMCTVLAPGRDEPTAQRGSGGQSQPHDGATRAEGSGDGAGPSAALAKGKGDDAGSGPLSVLLPLWRERKVLTFVCTTTALSGFGEAVSAFAAIRLTRPDELAASAELYGTACSVAALTSLTSVLLLGWCLDRFVSVKTALLVLYGLKSAAIGAMGFVNDPLSFAVCLVAFRTVASSTAAPMSMWIGRGHQQGLAGTPLSAAFVAMKLGAATVKGIASVALSVAVQRASIVTIFCCCSMATLPLLTFLTTLREPPRPVGTPAPVAVKAEDAAMPLEPEQRPQVRKSKGE